MFVSSSKISFFICGTRERAAKNPPRKPRQDFETVYADYLSPVALASGQVNRDSLPPAKWYITDRQDDTGYKDFVDATKSIA